MEVQRLTDQNHIALSLDNEIIEKKECNEFIKEFIEVPEDEVAGEVEGLEKNKLHLIYQYVESEGGCVTLGSYPNVPLADVY